MLQSPQGYIIPQAVIYKFHETNNKVEYEALVVGLNLVQDLHIKDIQLYLDSLLIANHFNRSYVVKGENLSKYLEIVKANWQKN